MSLVDGNDPAATLAVLRDVATARETIVNTTTRAGRTRSASER
ncbi:hypothetical protein [Embleya hyalina]|uniref:Uncharacterized protein n=1 Tax=Embleya hyalina TaxID=516124 RepID=A0A401Z2E6_9ACTN|nr:hypothetical protein [Embleya hyalina]GCE01037.1 hypothetical protein EHYA_08776 [Embleya hyalina]